MKKFIMPAALVCLLAVSSVGAAYPEPAETQPLSLNDGTELYVMNGRLGSRHFFALDLKNGRADVGAMGFDCSQTLMIFGEAVHQRSVELDALLNNYSLYAKGNALKLEQRELDLGMTYSCAKGTDPSGLILTHCVISPMAFPKSLDDEEGLKTAIAPFFYHTLKVENPTDREQSAEVVFALGGKGRRPRLVTDGIQAIGLPEGRSNRFSFEPPSHALAAASPDSWIISGDKNGFVFNFSLCPKESATRTVVQAAYTDKPVIKNVQNWKKSKFYYTRFWKDLDEVIGYALDHKDEILERTARVESLLDDADASPERKWLMALTFHTWLCNTWLVYNHDRGPAFYVWEGDYAYHSTIDVAHETEVMAYFMPWTLKLQLQEWAQNTGKTRYGRFIRHDVGRDQLVGYSGYENPFWKMIGLVPMPVEENANYALLMHWYDHIGNDPETIKALLPTMETMLLENIKRDEDGNGIADHDTGTTYDVSDALHVSPNNVYLGIKQMTANLVGADLLDRYANGRSAATLRAEAKKILAAILDAQQKYGYLPTSLDTSYAGWDQRSVVLGDALLYPSLTGFRTPELDKLEPVLAENFAEALEKSRRSYGVVMTEGEGVIFYSKVMVMEPVSKYFYHNPTELWQGPYEWNRNNDKAYNDGAYSATRDWTGYKYSRGVISLWPLLPAP